MAFWNYKNIGASSAPQNNKHIEKIFGYMGYVSRQNCVYENGRSFQKPAVYYCMRSADPRDNCGKIKFKDLEEYSFVDLRNLLNALFPETVMSLHMSIGSNTSDTEENHDEIHQPYNMTVYGFDSYIEEGQELEPNRSWKARFALEAPKMEYVQALIKASEDDGNAKLTTLLQELAEKIRDGKIVYPDNPSDNRPVDEKYDVIYDVKPPQISANYYPPKEERIKVYRTEMEEAYKAGTTVQQMIVDILSEYADQETDFNPDIYSCLDTDANVIFAGKHFVLSGFRYTVYENGVIAEIEKRGGIVHSSMVKMADYLVVNLRNPGVSKIKKALEWRQKGATNLIVSDYQLWQAIFNE